MYMPTCDKATKGWIGSPKEEQAMSKEKEQSHSEAEELVSSHSLSSEDIATVKVDRRSFLAKAMTAGSVGVGAVMAAGCPSGSDMDGGGDSTDSDSDGASSGSDSDGAGAASDSDSDGAGAASDSDSEEH